MGITRTHKAKEPKPLVSDQGVNQDLEIGCPNLLEIQKSIQNVYLFTFTCKWQMK